ncbi:hypothetical protein [Thermococcus barossii]|nr:hypothetical protein [Thermococcus barossii]
MHEIYKKASFIAPIIYLSLEGIVFITVLIGGYLAYLARVVLIEYYTMTWIIVVLLLFYLKQREHHVLISVPFLEMLETSRSSPLLGIVIFILSSPILADVLFLNGLKSLTVPNSDIKEILAVVIFSAGFLVMFIEKTLEISKDYSKIHITKVISRTSTILPKLRSHIVIGGYGNIGQRLAERLLQMLYIGSMDNEKWKMYWVWIFDGTKLKLEKLFPFLVILDPNTDKWDYKLEDPYFKSLGLEAIIPTWGDRVFVPIVGSDLKSDNTWKLLNFERAKAVIQTFKNKETESYLLQRQTLTTVVIRSSVSTSYSEISEKDETGKALRFYPPFELGTLLLRRLYAALSETFWKGQSYIIFLIGNGPEVYYALKAWDKLVEELLPRLERGRSSEEKVQDAAIDNGEAKRTDEKCAHEFLKNIIVISSDNFIKENSSPLELDCDKENNSLKILNEIFKENSIDNEFIRKRLIEYYLPIRHDRQRGFKKVATVYVLPEVTFRVIKHLCNIVQTLNKTSRESRKIVPIFVIIGKEGISESLCLEVFKALSGYTEDYWIIAPYFFRNELERLLESAYRNGIDLNRVHLFHPYKTIREGVSNFVRWD